MVVNEKLKINVNKKVSELTVRELRNIIQEIVQDTVEQAVLELEQRLPDPDEGKALKPEAAEELRQYLLEQPEGEPAEDVMRELGLLDE